MSKHDDEQAPGLPDAGGDKAMDTAYLFAAIDRLLALLQKESIDYMAADVGAHWRPLIRLLNVLPGIVAEGPEAVAEAAEQLSGLGRSSTGKGVFRDLAAAPDDDSGDTALAASAALDRCPPPWVWDPITGTCVWPDG